ncbi:MAG: SRPBCC domain-containing protein [Bacteroidota bacterium]
MKSSASKTTALKTKVIKQKVIIPAPPSEVYDAFLDARKHSEFTRERATCDPKEGGKISAWDGYISGKNLKLVKGKRILQEWITTDWVEGYPASKLDLLFAKKGNGTELTMIHSNVPAALASSFAKGWKDHYWALLKEYFQEMKTT